MRRSLPIAVLACAVLPLVAAPLAAWTPKSQVEIAREAVQLAPPDLKPLIQRNLSELDRGVVMPFSDTNAADHYKNADGTGRLDQVIPMEVARAVAFIKEHRPFADIVFQLGVVSHYMADADNPLNTSESDPREGDYFANYLYYAQSAEPRFDVVFYGIDRDLTSPAAVRAMVARALARGRTLYPLIGLEYRRIGFLDGIRYFDDKSTAFGVAAVSFSHAVSDVVDLMRYIWIAGGGADHRPWLPSSGGSVVVLLPRIESSR